MRIFLAFIAEYIYNISEEAGAYKGFYFDKENNVEYTLSVTEDSVIVSTKAKYEKRDVNISHLEEKVDKELKDITRIALNKEIKFS